MINEALVEEARRAEQRRRRDGDAKATVPVPDSARLAERDPKENSVEPDPDPKRRLLMESVASAASDSGQQREKRSVTNTEAGTQARDPMEMGIGGKNATHSIASEHQAKDFHDVRASRSHHTRSNKLTVKRR